MRGALLAWATADLCFASTLNVELAGSQKETRALETYVEASFHLATLLYERLYVVPKAELSFTKEVTATSTVSDVLLNSTQYYLGFSGGKDSTLSLEIMEKAGVDVIKFMVAYDDNAMAPEGRVRKGVQNARLFDLISPSRRKPLYKNFEHQEDDIHATILAPYTSQQNWRPATVALGLPWEVLHCLNDGSPDLVPFETLASLHHLMTFAQSVGLTSCRIVSPIASLSSFGVYRLLGQWHGREALSDFYSCWQENPQLPACGECTKCRRVRLVESHLFGEKKQHKAEIAPSYAKMFGSVYSELLATHSALCGPNVLVDDVTAQITETLFVDVLTAARFDVVNVTGLTVGLDVLGEKLVVTGAM